METLIIGIGAVVAALASPLSGVFMHVRRAWRRENPLLHAWETAMMHFSSFGMMLLAGMIFLIVFVKLYALFSVLQLAIPVAIAILGLFDIYADAHKGFGFSIFPPKIEREKWYHMITGEQHPAALGSLAAAGELFTSGTPILLLAAYLALPTAASLFNQLSPLLWFAAIYTLSVALLSIRERKPHQLWNLLLGIGLIAATAWMLFI